MRAVPASISLRLPAGLGAQIRSGSTQLRVVRSVKPQWHSISLPSRAAALPTLRSQRQRAPAGSMRCSADSSASGGQRKPKRNPSTKTKNQNENLKRERVTRTSNEHEHRGARFVFVLVRRGVRLGLGLVERLGIARAQLDRLVHRHRGVLVRGDVLPADGERALARLLRAVELDL